LPCMPGPLVATDKLHNPTVTPQVKMGGDLNIADRRKIRVREGIQIIQKETLNPLASELFRRQTDIVNDKQRD